MITYQRRGNLVLVIEDEEDDLGRAQCYTQRRLYAIQNPPTQAAKAPWWPRFLRWWCGVPEPTTTQED